MAFFKNPLRHPPHKRFYYKLYKSGKTMMSAWYERHAKTLRYAGLGGKSHSMEKGHVTWNRKGRW